MNNMYIRVEFLVGTTLENAVQEAKYKAEKWDVALIKFNFNGVEFSIGRNADVCEVLEQFRSALQSQSLASSGIISA